MINGFAGELEKLANNRRRSSKAKRAAGISAGATTGAMFGIPTGLLMSLALMAAGKKTGHLGPQKGVLRKIRYLRKGGFARDMEDLSRIARRQAIVGGAAGAGSGALIGGLAGHEVSKHAAALKSRITPQSSNVRGFSYDPKSREMLITYKGGGTYRYAGVPPAIARAMGRNKSVGKTVHRRIKAGGYKYTKVGKDLTAMGRKHVKAKNFALPGARYPIHDRAHARNALARVAQHGSPAEIAKVRAKVYSRYPGIGKKASYEASGSPNENGSMMNRVGQEGFISERVKSMDRGVTPKDDKLSVRTGPVITKDTLKYAVAMLRKHAEGVGTRTPGFVGGGGEGGEEASGGGGGSVVPDDAGESMIALEVPKLNHPLPKRIMKNLADKAEKLARAGSGGGFNGWASTGGTGDVASQTFVDPSVNPSINPTTSVVDQMKAKRRKIQKMAGAAKKTHTWNGLTMKFEHLKGDTRTGTHGITGKRWSRKMHDHYGYMPGTYGKGADGEAIDVYFSPNPVEGTVYKIRQKKKTGEYDEDKFMVGYQSATAARKAFLRNMPEWAFDSMSSMSTKAFRRIVGQGEKKVSANASLSAARLNKRKPR